MATFTDTEARDTYNRYVAQTRAAHECACAAALSLEKKKATACAAREARERAFCAYMDARRAARVSLFAETPEAARCAEEAYCAAEAKEKKANKAEEVARYELDGYTAATLRAARAVVTLRLASAPELDGTPSRYKVFITTAQAAASEACADIHVFRRAGSQYTLTLSYRGEDTSVSFGVDYAGVFHAQDVVTETPETFNPREVQRLARRGAALLSARAAEVHKLREKWREQEKAAAAIPSLKLSLYEARA